MSTKKTFILSVLIATAFAAMGLMAVQLAKPLQTLVCSGGALSGVCPASRTNSAGERGWHTRPHEI